MAISIKKKHFYSGWKITVDKPDNCVILKNIDVIIVKNIVLKDNGESALIGSPFPKNNISY